MERIGLDEESQVSLHITVVDDKDVVGASLGIRRLKLLKDNVTLARISRAIYFLGDLIKVAKTTTWFIDTNGYLFQLKKSSMAKLECYKIKEVIPTTGLGAVVEVEGIPIRFKTAYKPYSTQHYAGILQLGLTYIFYGYYEEPFKPTKRLI